MGYRRGGNGVVDRQIDFKTYEEALNWLFLREKQR